MTSTGYCRDQYVVCQVQRGKTVEELEDDHGNFELYSLPDADPFAQRRCDCDVVKLSCAVHNERC